MDARILNMSVRGFLRVKEASLDLTKKCNIFIGPNRSGKSSLASGPEWALTGLARGVHFKNRTDGFINDGADKAEVVLKLENDITIGRHRTKSTGGLRVVCKGREETEIPTEMTTWVLGINPNSYFSLSEKDRIDLIYKLVYRDKSDLDADIYNALIELGFSEDLSVLQAEAVVLQGFDEACNLAGNARREAKRRLEAVQSDDPAKCEMYGETDLSGVHLDEMNSLLAECEGQKNELIEKRGKVSASRTKTQVSADLGNARRDLERQEIAAKNDIKEVEHKRKSAIRTRESLTKERDAKIEERAKVKAILDLNVDFAASRCPIMPMDCPVSPKEREPIHHAHVTARDNATERLPLVEKNIESLNATLEGSSTKLREIRDTLDAATQAQKELPEVREKVATLERELKNLPVETVDEIAAQIATLTQRITNGRDLIEAKKKYDALVTAAKDSETKITEIQKEIEVADKLAKALAPDGIPKILLDKALGKFIARLNESAAIFGDEIDLGDDYMPVLNGHHWQFLSGSERWLAKTIFQEAIAHVSGCPWFLLDEVDILDGQHRGAFMAFLQHIAPAYSTIMAFVTVGDMEPRGSANPLIDIWKVEDGTAVKLAAEKQAA